MPWELAQKGIDFLLAHSMDQSTINLGFYGGEPLLNFPLVQRAIEYIKKMGEGREITFALTTNGTIMNDEIVQFLLANNVDILLSFDGPSEVHDKNRIFADGTKGTFQKIESNLQWLHDNYPDLLKKIGFSVVMDPSNDFSCINDFFLNYWAVRENSLIAPTIVNNDYNEDETVMYSKEFMAKMRYETFKLYMTLCDRFPADQVSIITKNFYARFSHAFSQSLGRSQLPDTHSPGGPCVPGPMRLFMDVEGNFYPCERVSEKSECMRIGNVDAGFDLEKCEKLLNVAQLTKEECRDCFAFAHCSQCGARADQDGTLDKDRRLSYCNGVRNGFDNDLRDYITLLELQNMMVGR